MHDPMTVAFYFWSITIWHVDPEKDGIDDSCGWVFPHLTKKERAEAETLITNPGDNIKSFFKGKSEDEMINHVSRIFRLHKRVQRPWWKHPRWHFWHWKIKVGLISNFKRWAFSRCQICKGRFKWGETPVGYGFGASGPRWFKNEKVRHSTCETEGRKEERLQKKILNKVW